tara:strand:+ start:514 stop:1299 length:786 start_codon:yes stop_codon:yes gene_type:complete
MAKLADIVFTLDTTGSMSFAIDAMKDTITQLADVYLEARIDTRLGVIQFRDRVNFGESDSGNPTLQRESFGGSGFTSDPKDFRDAVSWYRAAGGGPNPESSFDALALASRSEWRDEANRIIIHITDAPPHLPDREIRNVEALIDMLSDAYVDQLHFIVPESSMDSFESLTEVKSDGSTGDRYAICSWTNIEADREDIIEKLRKIAKTSSGSVYDKAELISRDDEPETEIDFDNPFDTTEDEEDEEIEGDPLGSANPFDDLD